MRLTLVLLPLLAVGSVQAADQAPAAPQPAMHEQMKEHWKAADKDGNGAIDLSEAKAGMPMLAEHFADVDINKDGKVTPDEMKAHHQRVHPEAPPAP